MIRLPQVATSSSLMRRSISESDRSVSFCSGSIEAMAYLSASGWRRSAYQPIDLPTPSDFEALAPLKVMYWLAGTFVGRFSPPYPISIDGQITV